MDNHLLSYKPSTKTKKQFLTVENESSVVRPRSVSFTKTDDESQSIVINLVNQPEAEQRTNDTLINENDLYLAATYIIDANYSRNYDFKTDSKSLNNYHLYNTWLMQYILYFFVALDLALAVFEEPAIEGLNMPYWSTQLLELACLAFFVFRMAHHRSFTPAKIWWRDAKNIVLVITICIECFDMLLIIILMETNAIEKPFRWTRILRPLFLVNFPEMREIRRSFRNIRRSLIEIQTILVLFFLLLLLFALLGRELYADDQLGKVQSNAPYFQNYFENFWDLYILVTTANSPDIMMPAYDASGLYMLFFIIFILLCNYIFMSIFLAVIYKNYRKHLKNEVKTSVFMKRRKLTKAWNILHVSIDGKFVVNWERFKAIMVFVSPKFSEIQIRILWKVLDTDDSGTINKQEFLRIVDLLNVKLATVTNSTPFFKKWMPTCYTSRVSSFICKCVKHRFFQYFFDFVIIVNTVFIIIQFSSEDEWYFLAIFMAEIVIKMYVYGFNEYFHDSWNVFDFLIIFTAFAVSVAEEIAGTAVSNYTEDALDFILVLRVLRMLRVIGNISSYKVILSTLGNIGPSILTFGCIMFVILYVFAILGMGFFGGKITYHGYPSADDPTIDPSHLYCGTGNPNFTKTEYFVHQYCKNNFNDILKSFVILFELMVVNQWHEITNGYVFVTNVAARIYFLLYHIVMVIIFVNIFIAFILEVFMVEYSLSKNKFENAIEKKIEEFGLNVEPDEEEKGKKFPVKLDKLGLLDNIEDDDNDPSTSTENRKPKDPGIRFRLGRKTRNVQLSLQAMFEGELDDENNGPEDLENIDDLDEEDNEKYMKAASTS